MTEDEMVGWHHRLDEHGFGWTAGVGDGQGGLAAVVHGVANIQKTKIRGSGPITSWQIDGETMETVRDFIFLGYKITADGDCSHEIK